MRNPSSVTRCWIILATQAFFSLWVILVTRKSEYCLFLTFTDILIHCDFETPVASYVLATGNHLMQSRRAINQTPRENSVVRYVK